MVFFNYALRKLNAKIVYYGPGLCGKTTNLQWIHDHFEGGQRGKMISLATEGDRTIFFDLLPIDIGSIRGMDVTLQLYTVPGQVHYNSTRQLVLRGADGVVFVADSQRTMKASNTESFENLQENLMLQGIDLKEFPHILQFNKRDLRDLLSTEDLNESLNVFSVPIFEAIATEGIGVQESLEGIVKLVMRNLREKYEPVANAGVPQGLKPMQAGPPPSAAPPGDPTQPPKVSMPEPLAPDFASETDAPPSAPQPTAPPSFVAPAAPTPPAEEAPEAEPDLGFASLQDEDGIPTAVYEGSDEKIAEIEAALEKNAFPADEATPATDALLGGEAPDRGDGLFTDPRDEDGTGDSPAPDVEFGGGTSSDEPPRRERETGEYLSTDPDFVESDLGSEVSEESVDDLFDAEPPTVKAFIDDVMDVVEVEGNALTDDGDVPLPPLVDPSATVAAPIEDDRYKDRIEAPGPFAPPPSADAGDDAAAELDSDQQTVDDQVRQAFGSSENREALASLSHSDPEPGDAPVRDEGPAEFLDDPPGIEPPADAPETPDAEPVEFVGEVPPAEVASEEADVLGEAGGESSSAEPPRDADMESVETVVDELARTDPVAAETQAPDVEEAGEHTASATDEPEIIETIIAEPPAPDEVEEPPAAEPTDAPPPATAAFDKSQPIMVGSGDPFAADDVDLVVPDVVPDEGPMVPAASAIDVTAADNQLHLQLKGSGAIAEMGQVRALDIEVPVPGQWVGNRKVTLQLRLTLTPAEDENG
jgi:signal recognition particle receptor subunit beta